jgi:uncharacterized protein (UPF0548 family)
MPLAGRRYGRDNRFVTVQELDEARASKLRAAPFTYAPVGATSVGPPAGFAWFERSTKLVRRDFDAAALDLFMWRLHGRAGLRVEASDAPLRQDTVVLMRLGVGPASLRIPCRVVYVINETELRGFAYGTLPGHPEAGEERFMLHHHPDGSIGLTISAFSRSASRLAKLGGPVSRTFQGLMTHRYIRALDRL